MNIVSVSTLPMDFQNLELDLLKVNTADYIHVDVMDGEFVEQETIWTEEVKKLRDKTNLILNVHLMIEKPEKHVEDFIEAGGDIINFHIEAAKDPEKVIKLIKEKGAKAGIALNPDTPLSKIKKLVPELDQVMIMSVVPGKGGQSFIPDVLDKVKKLREMDKELDIEVDGGVNEKTGEKCVEAGANILCSGSYIFSFGNPKIGIDILRNI